MAVDHLEEMTAYAATMRQTALMNTLKDSCRLQRRRPKGGLAGSTGCWAGDRWTHDPGGVSGPVANFVGRNHSTRSRQVMIEARRAGKE
jgi:hypothetical protein